jgi:hypothetical protein
MGYVRPLSVTRRAAPRRGRRVADRAADLAVKKGFERVLLCRQTTNRCLPLWLGYNTVPVAGSARTAPAPPLPSLLLRLFLAFFWPSLIFALRSSRSLSRASLSSCAAKQNRHAFHFWVLAFKLFLGLNRATVLCVFVETTNRARGVKTNHNRHRAREREKERAWAAKLRLDAPFPRFTFSRCLVCISSSWPAKSSTSLPPNSNGFSHLASPVR